jgi:hypothetical protein
VNNGFRTWLEHLAQHCYVGWHPEEPELIIVLNRQGAIHVYGEQTELRVPYVTSQLQGQGYWGKGQKVLVDPDAEQSIAAFGDKIVSAAMMNIGGWVMLVYTVSYIGETQAETLVMHEWLRFLQMDHELPANVVGIIVADETHYYMWGKDKVTMEATVCYNALYEGREIYRLQIDHFDEDTTFTVDVEDGREEGTKILIVRPIG